MGRSTRFDWLFRPQMADEDMPLSAEARFGEALSELPAPERSALALSEIGGLDTIEIARRLGTEPQVAAKLLERARATVRVSLGGARRTATALLPFHGWLSGGGAAPAARTAGVVAATVLGTSVAIGGAAADTPRLALASPELRTPQTLSAPTDRIPAAPAVAAVPAASSTAATPVAERAPEKSKSAAAPRVRSAAPPPVPGHPVPSAPAAEPLPIPQPAPPPAPRPAPPPAAAERPVTTAAETATPRLPLESTPALVERPPLPPPPVEPLRALPPAPAPPQLPVTTLPAPALPAQPPPATPLPLP